MGPFDVIRRDRGTLVLPGCVLLGFSSHTFFSAAFIWNLLAIVLCVIIF